jgi:hypothetical protein
MGVSETSKGGYKVDDRGEGREKQENYFNSEA